MHVCEGDDKNDGDGMEGTTYWASHARGTVLSAFTVSQPSQQRFEIGVTISSILLPRKRGL